MLKQIIKDMYIDPDLLAELSDEQKQMIFIKIREEQIRRWRELEDKLEKQKPPVKTKRSNLKAVSFLMGEDKNPWVWVMGEHPNDKSIDEILEEEAMKSAREKAEKEALVIKEREEKEAARKLKEDQERIEKEKQKQQQLIDAKIKADKEKMHREKKAQDEIRKLKSNNTSKKDQEKSEKARLTRELSYRELKEKRANEILTAFHNTKALWEKKALEENKQLDQAWQQQEKKAKQAETKLRQLVKSAREDYKRNTELKVTMRGSSYRSREVFRESAVLLGNALTAVKAKADCSATEPTNRPPRPESRAEALNWFRNEEKPKGAGQNSDGLVEPWFHGIVSREDSEKLLEGKPVNSFLVRVSEKIWGYAISYKAEDRCKHYLVDTNESCYQFFGTNQLEHQSLSQLVQYHKNHAVSTAGQELLKHPVDQIVTPPDYADLFPELLESTSL